MVKEVFEAFRLDPNSVDRLMNFLPYPFLIAVRHGEEINTWKINQRFKEEIGYEVHEIHSLEAWFEKAYPDPTYRNELQTDWSTKVKDAIANGKDHVMARAKIQTKHNGAQWYEVKTSITAGGVDFVAFVNINEVVEREHELFQSNENKNRILSILGHDIRTPVMQLNKLTEFMLGENLSQTDFVDTVSKVNELSKQSLQFLETTLIWTKNNFDHISTKRDYIQLKPWLIKIIELYQSTAENKDLNFKFSVDAKDKVISDSVILHIVMRNLITNAIKFSEDHSEINIVVDSDEEICSIAVIDEGIGMDQETVDAILSENTDYQQASPKRGGGFGIGLRLCREVLKGIGGELRIDTTSVKGTKVSVLIPHVSINMKD